MKKRVIFVVIICSLIIVPLISANWFTDLLDKLSGKNDNKNLKGQLSSLSPISQESSAASIKILPVNSQINFGWEFQIDVNVSDVVDLYGAHTNIVYDPNILEYKSITEGSFLKTGGAQAFSYYNVSTPGLIMYMNTRIGPYSGISGSGNIAKIVFSGKGTGTSGINIIKSSLMNSVPLEMEHSVYNASASVGGACVDADSDTYDTCSPGDNGDDGKGRDCNDANANINPGAIERCNNIDDDCDLLIDENNGDCTAGYICQSGQCVVQNIPIFVSIIYPEARTYTSLVSDLKYSVSYGAQGALGSLGIFRIFGVIIGLASSRECWYSTNNGVTNSTHVSAGTNFTNLVSVAGSNTWIVWCSDENGKQNSSQVTFNICTPNCQGKLCGNDGCGGTCGVCSEATPKCNQSGNCVECLSNGDCTGGKICSNGHCVSPGECQLTSYSWDKSLARDGEVVNIALAGTNCQGQMMNIIIMEKDRLSQDDIVETFNRTFSNTIPWTAKWQRDEFGPPEYYFIINISGRIYGSDRDKLIAIKPTKRDFEVKPIQLNSGKNPFSLPLIPENLSVENVFRNVKNNIIKVYTYDDGWKIYYPDKTNLSNLKKLKPGLGYVILMKDGTTSTLSINGSKLNESLEYPRFTLRAGWNLIGTFSNRKRFASEVLNGINYDKMYYYDRTENKFKEVTGDQELDEKESYWINVTDETIFTPITGDVIAWK